MSIEEKTLELLTEVCGTKKIRKNKTIDLIQEGYLDSLGIVELLTEIEDEFEIEIPLETFDPKDFCTAEKIISYVTNNIT